MTYELPNVESFYSGTYVSAPSETYGQLFTGYRLNFGRIGSPTSFQTANQISEVAARVKEGTKVVELQPLQPEIFDTIPQQMFTEIKQHMKLAGADPTLHAPLIDPAGFTEGGMWTETNRANSEREMFNAVKRAHDMDAKGNIPVTFHATGARGIPSYDPVPGQEEKKEVLYVIDKVSGQLYPIKRETTALPAPIYEFDDKGMVKVNSKGEPITDKRVKEMKKGSGVYELPPEIRVDELNRREWSHPLSTIEYNKTYFERNFSASAEEIEKLQKIKEMHGLSDEQQKQMNDLINQTKTIKNQAEDAELQLRNLFTEAFTLANEKEKEVLQQAAKKYTEAMKKIGAPNYDDLIEHNQAKFAQIVDIKSRAEAEFINDLRRVNPKRYIPAEEFALEKTQKTIGNIAFKAFQQFGEKAPIISVENVMPNTVFGRAESLKQLIIKSREEFVKNAKESGMSQSDAESAAKKLIGATWDTGHINLIRKYGFGEKDPGKFMAEEAKKIAPYVKHVHLADNFGFNETHLPPGMGNVPFKEILKEMEKAGFSGKHIVEAGNFVAQKMGMPTPYVLEAFGSPIYGAVAQPYWNQARAMYGFPQGYFGGYGTILPDQHFSMYSAGFSSLPQELGGQVACKGQRFSGAPME